MRAFRLLFSVALLSLSLFCHGQNTQAISDDSLKILKDDGTKINSKILKFGASLGFNRLVKEIYDPVLSPVDQSLKLQKINPVSLFIRTF